PDDLVEEVKVPNVLAQYDELMGVYGDIAQAVRAIFDGYLGWFDGNATNLNRLPKKDHAEKYVELAGGFHHVLAETSKALLAEDYQWEIGRASCRERVWMSGGASRVNRHKRHTRRKQETIDKLN